MTSAGCIALLALTLSQPAVAFVPNSIWGGSTHVSITYEALLQKVTDTCWKLEEVSHEFKKLVGWKIVFVNLPVLSL